jgi:molecular chaperone GrpE (heat shock protein)
MAGQQSSRWVSLFSFLAGIGTGLFAGQRLQLSSHARKMIEARYIRDYGDSVIQRPLDGKDKTIQTLEQKNVELVNEYQRLQAKFDQAVEQSQDRERLAIFRLLEPFLMQLPVLAEDIEEGNVISPADVIGLLKMIPDRLRGIEIERIGEIGQQVEFDLRKHTPSLSNKGLIKSGQIVTIAVPGYRYRDEIVMQAEVKKGFD